MNETVQQTLIDTLDYLMALVRQDIRPEQARSGLRPLQMRHAGVGIQLIWEEETYDRSIHYDALLNLPGNGTVSLSFCDDHAKPWPLRGVHRWSDADLVRVNHNVLTVDQAIACLDFIWDEARITDRLVNVCLIQEELERNPIDLSDQELQLAMDGFRRARRLYRSEDTYRWMERRGISHQEFEQLVGSQATIAKLRDRTVADLVPAYFDSHSADFDTAHIARFSLPDETAALETVENIRSAALDFFGAAQSHFLAAARSNQQTGELFTSIKRRDAPEAMRSAVFGAAPGTVVNPVRGEDGFAIIRVLSVVPASLNESTRNEIKTILFEKWLEERRQAAAIDWLWGNVSKTAPPPRNDAVMNLSHAG